MKELMIVKGSTNRTRFRQNIKILVDYNLMDYE